MKPEGETTKSPVTDDAAEREAVTLHVIDVVPEHAVDGARLNIPFADASVYQSNPWYDARLTG